MRRFRTGATRKPFYVWAGLLAVLALVLIRGIPGTPPGSIRIPLYSALALACVLLGPAALAAHLWRRTRVWVVVDRSRGLEVSGRRVLPWRDIEAVESRGPLIGAEREEDTIGVLLTDVLLLSLCFAFLDVPDGAVLPILLFSLPIPYAVFRFLLAPMVSLLSPWHSRVTLRGREGEALVLRDLEDADEFVRLLPSRIRREPAAAGLPGSPP